MKKYGYKFVKVQNDMTFKSKRDDAFEECKQVIEEHAEQGWRLKQILVPFNEKTYQYEPYCYQIIFEKEL
jgi:hypothetical protein